MKLMNKNRIFLLSLIVLCLLGIFGFSGAAAASENIDDFSFSGSFGDSDDSDSSGSGITVDLNDFIVPEGMLRESSAASMKKSIVVYEKDLTDGTLHIPVRITGADNILGFSARLKNVSGANAKLNSTGAWIKYNSVKTDTYLGYYTTGYDGYTDLTNAQTVFFVDVSNATKKEVSFDLTFSITVARGGLTNVTSEYVINPYSVTAYLPMNVSFNANGADSGNVPGTTVFMKNDSIVSSPGNLKRSGFVFAGWNTEKNGSGIMYPAGNEISYDKLPDSTETELYAIWAYALRNVSYELSGEIPEGANPLPEISKHEPGSTVSLFKMNDVAGYTFSGWTTNNKGVIINETDNSFKMPESDVLFTGSFEENTATVVYKISDESASASAGSVTVSTETTLAKTGKFNGSTAVPAGKFRFVSWTDENGNIVSENETFIPQKTASGIYESATYTANFERVYAPITVNFNANEKSGAGVNSSGAIGKISGKQDPVTVSNSSSILSETNFTRVGHEFAGWNLKEDGSGTFYPAGTTIAYNDLPEEGSVTLYAIWNICEYTVSYAYDKTGKIPQNAPLLPLPEKVGFASIVEVYQLPETAGYNFSGWKTNNASIVSKNGTLSFEMPAKDVVLSGKFSEANVTISYIAAKSEGATGGTVTRATETLLSESGKAKGSTAVPAENYHFVSWTDSKGKVVSKNETFIPSKNKYGIYESATYKANFGKNGTVVIHYEAGTGGKVSLPVEYVLPFSGIASGSTATADEGYIFINWTDEKGTIVSEDETFIPQKTNNRYYDAKYTANFKMIGADDPDVPFVVRQKDLERILTDILNNIDIRKEEPAYDVTKDGIVDGRDFIILQRKFEQQN